MKEIVKFEYYYGNEAEQYSFFRIPKTLFTDLNFKKLSVEAKILYGILLDRMSLSIKNKWLDEENKVYIIYTIEEIMEVLNWGRNKSVKVMKEIEEIGLLEKKRLGLGKPNLLYVKNFIYTENNKTTEVSKANLKKFKKQTSGSLENKSQEVSKEDSNNTNINNTETNNTDFNNTTPISPLEKLGEKSKKTLEEEELKETIKKNISYETFEKARIEEKKQVDVMINVLVKALTSFTNIKIGGRHISNENFKERFLSLNYKHIDYVLKYLRENAPKDIRNINAYLLTLLYNADENIRNIEVIKRENQKRENYDYSNDENIWREILNT
ncbi:replication initiator protein A [Peptoniphilus harei]|uniref:Replication initiator protein A (RepA) N-terminus n=1 Tax=Peptoniphilus harei TaxID=54005 RepID=A0A2X1XUY9_9FIRM|nr:replication initiator protein A [Peptoniphilus harei]QQT91457.1 replication initiator protein A [Peptoniphilus harei]SPY46409.1 Replication initiator protein A (RepA) N-terminus [Peptoniphilus harei]